MTIRSEQIRWFASHGSWPPDGEKKGNSACKDTGSIVAGLARVRAPLRRPEAPPRQTFDWEAPATSPYLTCAFLQSISQRHGAIEYRRARRRIDRVHKKVPHALKLKPIARGRFDERRLKLGW